MTSNDRLAALDGLRGWASLSVVVFHYCWETFGVLYPQFRSFVPSFLGNGNVAVAIFFTLSGYVLTLRRWGRVDNGILPLVLFRRYLRLTIPIMALVLITWAIMSLGIDFNRPASVVVNRPEWLGSFGGFPPDFIQAVWFGAARVYWLAPTSNYGPFLWTMICEFIGSMVVLTVSHWSRSRWVPYLVLLALTRLMAIYFPQACCFSVGALLALMQADGLIFRKEPGRIQNIVATLVLIGTLVAAALLQKDGGAETRMPAAILGIVIFVSVVRSTWASSLLTTPVSRWLGHISFPLYLMQYPVLVVPSSWLILVVSDAGLLSPWTALGITVFGIVASVLAAWTFVPVEQFTLKVVHAIGAWPRRRLATA